MASFNVGNSGYFFFNRKPTDFVYSHIINIGHKGKEYINEGSEDCIKIFFLNNL